VFGYVLGVRFSKLEDVDDVELGSLKEGAKPKKPGFWASHGEQFKSLLPHLWPEGHPDLKVKLVGAVIFLFASKTFSLMGPIQLKEAVDDVSEGRMPVTPVILYGLFRFGTDGSKEIRDCLFQYISAHAARKIALRVFTHVQQLSLKFHLNRKTGALLRAVSRGSAAYSDLLRYISFQIFPIFLEVMLVSTYLFTQYSWYFGIITLAVVFCYFFFTVVCTEWRNKFRRTMTEKDDQFNQKATDSLINFETVKLFNGEDECARVYDESLAAYQDASIQSQQSLSLLNMGQNVIISAGVASAMYLAGWQVSSGDMTVGDFVLIQVYILQLYTPLNFLGTYYRMIKQSLVDVEAMFKLLGEEMDVRDVEDAPELTLTAGNVEVKLNNIYFSYDKRASEKPVVRGVTFGATHGQKVAIVGTSGAGKSTLARLLYRLYDVDSGFISICGQNIAECTQNSVRRRIGIVPQDCVLWNDTLMYNIAFGKLASGGMASEAEVRKVVELSQLSNFVERQELGLDTVVGERGLRLSGGEKQRVAIARALLKNPPVMLYDEATSALDTHTEKEIQRSLDLAAEGRTSFMIAHRLSTIMNSDCIVVLDAGLVAEQGTHEELLARAGIYATLWQSQLTVGSREPSSADLVSAGEGA